MLATALLMVLAMKVHARLRTAPGGDAGASLGKASDAFADYILRRNGMNLAEPFDPDPRHLAHDKRRRPTLWQSVTYCLS